MSSFLLVYRLRLHEAGGVLGQPFVQANVVSNEGNAGLAGTQGANIIPRRYAQRGKIPVLRAYGAEYPEGIGKIDLGRLCNIVALEHGAHRSSEVAAILGAKYLYPATKVVSLP